MTPLPRLHAVTDDRVLRAPDFLHRANALAVGPEVAIHLRGRLSARELVQLASSLHEAIAPRGTQLFVHDRADVARLVGAMGLHLPGAGLPVAAARRVAVGIRWVGRSTHTPAEVAAAAAEGADYVFLGPIFPTASHPDRPPLGHAALGNASLPVVAIGGVTPDRVSACVAAGAYGGAAIRALWDADDPAAAARRFLLSFPQ